MNSLKKNKSNPELREKDGSDSNLQVDEKCIDNELEEMLDEIEIEKQNNCDSSNKNEKSDNRIGVKDELNLRKSKTNICIPEDEPVKKKRSNTMSDEGKSNNIKENSVNIANNNPFYNINEHYNPNQNISEVKQYKPNLIKNFDDSDKKIIDRSDPIKILENVNNLNCVNKQNQNLNYTNTNNLSFTNYSNNFTFHNANNINNFYVKQNSQVNKNTIRSNNKEDREYVDLVKAISELKKDPINPNRKKHIQDEKKPIVEKKENEKVNNEIKSDIIRRADSTIKQTRSCLPVNTQMIDKKFQPSVRTNLKLPIKMRSPEYVNLVSTIKRTLDSSAKELESDKIDKALNGMENILYFLTKIE